MAVIVEFNSKNKEMELAWANYLSALGLKIGMQSDL